MLKTSEQTTNEEQAQSSNYKSEWSRGSGGDIPGNTSVSSARASDRSDTVSDITDSAGLSAGERRVRPEELSEALRSLERKRREIFSGTLPIGDSLQELGASVTAEEVWQEIQSRRSLGGTLGKKKSKSGAERYIKVGVGLVALLATVFALKSFMGQAEEMQLYESGGKVTNPAPIVNPANTSPQPYALQYPSFFVQKPTMRPLSSIKEGEPIMMDMARAIDLNRMVFGDKIYKPAPREVLDKMFMDTVANFQNFQVVRYGNKFYIRAFTTGKPVHGQNNVPGRPNLPTDTIPLYTTPQDKTKTTKTIPPPPAPPGTSPRDIARFYTAKTVEVEGGPATTQIQIPLDALTGSYGGGGNGDYMRYDVDIDLSKLDGHAYDPWKQIMPVKPTNLERGFIILKDGKTVREKPHYTPQIF